MREPERIERFFDGAETLVSADTSAGYSVESRVADAHVARLRHRIERDHRHPERVLNVRGSGYKFVPRSTGVEGRRVR